MFNLPKNRKYSYILSTGRTGTVFVASYLSRSSDRATVLHEPAPSRYLIPLSNKYYHNQISSEEFSKQYFESRSSFSQELKDDHYIEVNNFLWSGIHALNNYLPEIKVVHIVRHPQDYILSHLNFGFWSFPKRIIRTYGPHYLADQNLTRTEKKNPIIILIKRWILINEHLETYKESNPYLRVRFEDLFSNKESSFDTFMLLRDFLELEKIDKPRHKLEMIHKKNQSVDKKYSLKDIEPYFNDYYEEILPHMSKYNYDRDHG